MNPYSLGITPQYDKTMRTLVFPCNSAIDNTCRFLESRGYRFLIDFGLDNAESLMWDLVGDQWGLQ
jgi:hypothetical protein